MDEKKPIKILRFKEVMEITSLPRMQVLRLAKQGLFPSPLQITQNVLGWRSNEIDDWIANLKPRKFNEAEDAYGKAIKKEDINKDGGSSSE